MTVEEEEKAKMFANKHTHSFTRSGQHTYHIGAYFACLEMAAWKQQQIIEWLDANASSYMSIYWEQGGYATPEYDTEKMLKDLKQAMEGE